MKTQVRRWGTWSLAAWVSFLALAIMITVMTGGT